jgi:BCD family chlorophyll transporter-like MFS transporter
MGWVAIFRLALVQMSLGAIVVLTTSTLNRVMAVEWMLPALVPGLLVGLHHAVQLTRPRMGHGSDVGGRRTPWIAGGMAVLALGGFLAALATAWMGSSRDAGLALAVVGYACVGLGVSAAGTSLLVLLAKQVAPDRRAAAATVVWVLMIVGFAVTAGLAGHWLDPFTPARLVTVSGSVSVIALTVALLALWGVERDATVVAVQPGRKPPFREVLSEVWTERDARRFTVFVFVSMIAYSMQDLILEPFAGVRFGLTPGETTRLSGLQHAGTLAGLLLGALAGRRLWGIGFGSLRAWIVGGCVASGLALAGLVVGDRIGGMDWPVRVNVFAMGVANGAFSIAAIGSMMALASQGRVGREGVRMGLWGASQAVGFALGGVLGTAAADLMRWWVGSQVGAYVLVFSVEALMFLLAAAIAARIAIPALLPAERGAALRTSPTAHPTSPEPAHERVAPL